MNLIITYLSFAACTKAFRDVVAKVLDCNYEDLAKLDRNDGGNLFTINKVISKPNEFKPIITDNLPKEIYKFANSKELQEFYKEKVVSINEQIKNVFKKLRIINLARKFFTVFNKIINSHIEELTQEITNILNDSILLESLIFNEKDWLLFICDINIDYKKLIKIKAIFF